MPSEQTDSAAKPAAVSRRTLLGAGLALTGTGLGAALLAACGQAAPSAGTAATSTKKVSLRFNWTVKGEFTPFFVAREKGFFKEQGIEADLLEGKSGTQAAQAVATGNDQFGYIPSVQVVQGINQGMPILTVATCGRNTGMCWAAWPDVPLSGPRSLEGRKVSISTSSTFFQVWEAFARKFGVDPNKVEVVAADPAARVGLFLQRQVEIMADIFLANDYVILQDRTKDRLNLLKIADLDFDPAGYLLVAHKPTLEGDRGLGKAFTQATLKGFRYTLDHPDEATQIMTRLFGEQLGASVVEGQVRQLLPLINKDPVLGKSESALWERSLEMLRDAGVVDKKLALGEYFTNDFV